VQVPSIFLVDCSVNDRQLCGHCCATALSSHQPSNLEAKVIVYCHRILTEVEMEWMAQYWLQGAEHNKMHAWWQRPMRTFEALWSSLEELTFQAAVSNMRERMQGGT
jgi:hypothetical protein